MAVPEAPPTLLPAGFDTWANAVTDSIIVLLAEAEFNPATAQTQTTTSSTFAELTSGGSTPSITFTMPASGEAVVEAEVWCDGDTDSAILGLALWESAAVVTGTPRMVVGDRAQMRVTTQWRITGTPAASRTVGLAIARSFGSSGAPAVAWGVVGAVNFPLFMRAFQMDPV